MSQKHKEILLKANAAITEKNNEKFLDLCTDDTQWIFVGDRTLNGKDEVRAYMATTYKEPPEFTVHNLISEGDYLTAVGEITLKDATGSPAHYSYCDVWRFRDDKLAELRAFVVKG